tara:strand:+ start:357 stop:506 length:150 start_codon:yes stop_codon:yes gene_type:complete
MPSFNKTDKKGREEEWTWEETPETKEAIAKLQQTIRDLELKAPDYGVGK